ncbi:hypothetical protein ACFVFS_05645 [Kitasatospora sp. NPDC057692]|uniref:hypothetical protein n=1 Tax=Kitasatospora sp. NPDC057692 TaxID=3346215 RepID=UPI003689B57E
MVRIVQLEADDVLVIGHVDYAEVDQNLFPILQQVLGVAMVLCLPGPVDLCAVRRHLDVTDGGG